MLNAAAYLQRNFFSSFSRFAILLSVLASSCIYILQLMYANAVNSKRKISVDIKPVLKLQNRETNMKRVQIQETNS